MEQKNLVKRPYGLAWKGGNNNLIIDCQDQDALKKIISEGLYQAISLYTKETPELNVKIMVPVILEKWRMSPMRVVTNAIKKIMAGERKIYGLVTPHDINKMIQDEVELLAIDQEEEHYDRKGYGEEDMSPRISSRFTDKNVRSISSIVGNKSDTKSDNKEADKKFNAYNKKIKKLHNK